MIGLFQENGPFRTFEMSNGTIGLFENPFSWSTIAHMLYIDFPIATGLSYVNESQYLPQSSSETARHLFSFLQTFLFTLYPQYSSNPIYLAGESYAGKYITEAAWFITQQNSLYDNPILLKGVMMGDALIDPIIQRSVKPDHAYWSGLMSLHQKKQLQGLESECIRQIQSGKYTQLDSACDTIKSHLLLVSGIINIYDIRRYDPSTNKTQIEIYLNQDSVRQALHINREFKPIYLSCETKTVYESMQNDILSSVKHLIPALMDHQIPVLLYNGNFDLQDGPVGTEHLLSTLFDDTWQRAPRNLWFVNGSVAGYVQQIPLLTFAVVFGSGHFVPKDQPLHSVELLRLFINQFPYCKVGETIPVKYSALTPSGLHHHLLYNEETKQYQLPCDISHRICESVLQHCHQHGECVQGSCYCHEGYVGESCAFAMLPLIQQESYQLSSNQHEIVQQEWQFYTLLLNEDQIEFSLQILTKQKMEENDQDYFVGRGLGNIMPSQRLCIYVKEDLLPSFTDFDFVYCLDAHQYDKVSLTIPLLSSSNQKKKKWIIGLFNSQTFVLSYHFHMSWKADELMEDELDDDLIAHE